MTRTFILELSAFFLSVLYLIFSEGAGAKTAYALILLISLKNVFSYLIDESINWKKIGFLFLCASFLYTILLPQISALELWNDEIGVIEISRLPFPKISSVVLNTHASVPPFDYWTLAIFKPLFSKLNPHYFEIAYRFPYILYHSISAILFCFIISNRTKNTSRLNLTSGLAFVTYFFNPYLFFYSLEVRYFALSTLGSLLVLRVLIENLYFDKKLIFLSLVLGLNSIFQFIVIGAYLIIAFGKALFQKDWKEALRSNNSHIVLFTHLILGLVLVLRMYYPIPTQNIEMLSQIQFSLREFINMNLQYPIQKALIFIFTITSIFSFKLRKGHKTNLYVLFVAFAGLFIISFLSYVKNYSYFGPRHYIFIIPFLLYLVFENISVNKHRFLPKQFIVFCIFSSFTIPWIVRSTNILYHQKYISKDLFGSKKIILKSQESGNKIVFTPNMSSSDSDFYNLSTASLSWYAEQYGMNYSMTFSKENGCQIFSENPDSVLVSIGGKLQCNENIFQPQLIVGSNSTIFMYDNNL